MPHRGQGFKAASVGHRASQRRPKAALQIIQRSGVAGKALLMTHDSLMGFLYSDRPGPLRSSWASPSWPRRDTRWGLSSAGAGCRARVLVRGWRPRTSKLIARLWPIFTSRLA